MTGLPESGRATSSSATGRRYVVITPARNEEQHLPDLIASMEKQRVRPACWIIVDDGSSDGSAAILSDASSRYPWIRGVLRPDRGHRKQGGGVIDAFYEGYQRVKDIDWHYLVKFDADLSFEKDYFERCLLRFEEDARLGIGGGMICQRRGAEWISESPGDPAFHVRGATKIYRRACWDAIGGLIRAPGWDTVDELKANMLGWRTETFSDIPLCHHRFTGSADGVWRNQVKFGISNYIAGYHPLFMVLKCLRRLPRRPLLLGSAGLFWGYWSARWNGVEQVQDPDLIRYVRQQQWNVLMGRESLWRPRQLRAS